MRFFAAVALAASAGSVSGIHVNKPPQASASAKHLALAKESVAKVDKVEVEVGKKAGLEQQAAAEKSTAAKVRAEAGAKAQAKSESKSEAAAKAKQPLADYNPPVSSGHEFRRDYPHDSSPAVEKEVVGASSSLFALGRYCEPIPNSTTVTPQSHFAREERETGERRHIHFRLARAQHFYNLYNGNLTTATATRRRSCLKRRGRRRKRRKADCKARRSEQTP